MPHLPSLCRARSQQEDASQCSVPITLLSNTPAAWHSLKHPFLLNYWRCSHGNDTAISSFRTVSLSDCSGASEKVLKLFHGWCKMTTCRPQVKICADAHQDLSHSKGTKTVSVGCSNAPLFLVVQMKLKCVCSCRRLKELMKSILICLSVPTTASLPIGTLVSPQLCKCCSKESLRKKILNINKNP